MWLYGWNPLTVSCYLAVFGGHWSGANRDILHLICHVTSKGDVIKGSHGFMGVIGEIMFLV